MFRHSLFGLALLPFLAAPLLAEGLRSALLSRQLYDTGVQMGDPLLVMSAAKLRKQLDLRRVERAPQGAAADMDTPAPHMGWQDMLDTAEDLAGANDLLLGLVADIRAERSKGLIGGRVYSTATLGVGRTDSYPELPFAGAEVAEIYLEGRGRGDLNLFVYDSRDRLVCSDTDISRIAYCYWRPAATDSFTVKVENKGPAEAEYSLMSN